MPWWLIFAALVNALWAMGAVMPIARGAPPTLSNVLHIAGWALCPLATHAFEHAHSSATTVYATLCFLAALCALALSLYESLFPHWLYKYALMIILGFNVLVYIFLK